MDSFEQLRVSCTKRAWRLAWASTRNETDAEDVMQQALIVAWRRREVIPAEAWPWFATVVVNCARNHRKKMNRIRLRESKLQPPLDDTNKLSPAERHELREQLLDALGDLPDGEREAVTLCHMAGLTQKQASGELGIPLNTVKSQAKRGLDRLRQRLGARKEGLEVYLATVAFPHPALGWEAATQRWRDGVESLAVKGSAATWPVVTAVLAVATLLAVLVFAPAFLSSGNPVPAPAETLTTASVLPTATEGGSTASDPSTDVSPESDLRREGSVASATDFPADVPPTTSIAPSLTPPANEPVGRTEVLPPGRNPPGSIQVRTDYYESGPIYTQWTELVTTGGTILEGSYRKFRLDGTVWEVSQFRNGLREGPWQRYHENGALACRGDFDAGQANGLWTWFHDNSLKMAEGSFVGGKKHDVWRAWHTNGERRFVESYERGKRIGVATTYDEQGRKIRETTWLNGVKHGPETEYDAVGNPLPPTIYENGERQ